MLLNAPKRHVVTIARREADKRSFGRESGQLVQIVTDGDKDLERYLEEFFPEAIHTIDVYHVTEYLWIAQLPDRQPPFNEYCASRSQADC